MKRLSGIILLALAAGAFANNARAQVVIIANPSLKTSEISKSELKEVFTGGSTSFKDGSRVAPILLKGGASNDEFLEAFVGKSDGAFKASWRSLVFSGQSAMPKTVDSEPAMVEYVARTPGAVGYIGKGTAHDGVKVLAVR